MYIIYNIYNICVQWIYINKYIINKVYKMKNEIKKYLTKIYVIYMLYDII